MKKTVSLTIFGIFILASCNTGTKEEIRTELKQYFDRYEVEGTFILYDEQANKYTYYNKELSNKGFIPASTFKIYNSLIGLETGVIRDENYVIPWDSVYREREVINKDQDLEAAFKNSALWYYQELARRVGQEQMAYWIDTLSYGNTDISENIDDFWIRGKLRISPKQQVDLLAKLKNNRLPFSQRSTDIVKKIMVSKNTSSYILRSKTGWGSQDGKDVGWYVGYIETKTSSYYFAICIQPKDEMPDNFLNARIAIADLIFNELKLLK